MLRTRSLTALMRATLVALLIVRADPAPRADDVSLEYHVKAVYLYNFVKFVDWPPRAGTGPITICVAGRNPFGTILTDTVRGESVNGRTIATRVILEPEMGCHVVFVPDGAATSAYLRAARGTPTLIVGETNGFLNDGGIINFSVHDGKVRFDINADAAERADLRISSRLLRLARTIEHRESQP